MLARIQNKIYRERRNFYRKRTPYLPHSTYIEANNQMYEPVLVGAETFKFSCRNAETVKGVLKIIKALKPDKTIEFLTRFYQTGLKNFGSSWKYADILTTLKGISDVMPISSYLEIGVRRGRSMAIVAALNPNCKIYGFDMWIPNYTGVENPGAAFVEAELKRVGYKGAVSFVDGDSKRTIPHFFKKNKDVFFDVITVDGDHSYRGAVIDLKNVIPRIKIGGILVFDDLVNPYHPYLMKVWDKIIKSSVRFSTYEFTDAGFGVGIAVKRY